jgi:hypothetical protein
MKEETKNKNLDLVSFVDRVIEEKNFPKDLEKEVLDQIREDLLSKVEDRVNAVIINNLKEDKLEEFNKMLDSNISDEEMQKFLSGNIDNLPELIASELIVFEQTYLS